MIENHQDYNFFSFFHFCMCSFIFLAEYSRGMIEMQTQVKLISQLDIENIVIIQSCENLR